MALTFWHQRDFYRVRPVIVGRGAVVRAELFLPRVSDDQRALDAVVRRVFQHLYAKTQRFVVTRGLRLETFYGVSLY